MALLDIKFFSIWILFFVYKANCESNENLRNTKVIELPVSKFMEPDCEYTVLQGTKFGNKVSREISIGEPLYHKWSCNYGVRNVRMYCIMVHNCTVSHSKDFSNKQIIPIIDEFGCSYFPSIIPHVEYMDDLQGGLPVNAFSLDIDKPALFFQCNIKLLIKINNVCRRPHCTPLSQYQSDNTN
uniref:ZP domain-containing protein n=1 Tax=Parastrongyloides trichosuri TaxID=131310 RepID=A0A0N5A3F9_PARTI